MTALSKSRKHQLQGINLSPKLAFTVKGISYIQLKLNSSQNNHLQISIFNLLGGKQQRKHLNGRINELLMHQFRNKVTTKIRSFYENIYERLKIERKSGIITCCSISKEHFV